MGACANSDEHRGRCGGGVPGTAVFGTKGGLTGVLSRALERQEVGDTLRARRTLATSGERLVGLLGTRDGKFLQGDDVRIPAGQTLELWYHVLGSSGFSGLEAFDASGIFYQRDLWSEAGDQTSKKIIRVTWGGARLYDRYREAVWDGKITIKGSSGIRQIEPLGGTSYVPEESVALIDKARVSFSTRTSGDYDGVNIFLDGDALPESVRISGSLGGYVNVGPKKARRRT
ncbi:hypothetical protein MPH_09277 [Macrophomina phaseolina MS6]|uniref:Uncharacterized protein n=1 Tax=Macrophomina phaseolina (strain MS6) TaxID=1126212 RepID=K2QVA4_MACPH|nr:hypothetical protein MPH_09277 [Macrophomina phaseolina MS6]